MSHLTALEKRLLEKLLEFCNTLTVNRLAQFKRIEIAAACSFCTRSKVRSDQDLVFSGQSNTVFVGVVILYTDRQSKIRSLSKETIFLCFTLVNIDEALDTRSHRSEGATVNRGNEFTKQREASRQHKIFGVRFNFIWGRKIIVTLEPEVFKSKRGTSWVTISLAGSRKSKIRRQKL